MNIREQFNAQVGEPDENGCLPWIGPRGGSRDRSGSFLVGGRFVAAHRWLWQHEFGPIPKGLELHHVCGNPLCVNLEHLRAVTPEAHWRLHGYNPPRSARLLESST